MTARAEPQDASPQDREEVLLALRDLKREWRDSRGIDDMGVSAPSRGVAPPNQASLARFVTALWKRLTDENRQRMPETWKRAIEQYDTGGRIQTG